MEILSTGIQKGGIYFCIAIKVSGEGYAYRFGKGGKLYVNNK